MKIPSKTRVIQGMRNLLHVLSRPAAKQNTKGLVILPYRGYGSRSEIFLMGRVFRQTNPPAPVKESLKDELKTVVRRIVRRGQAGVRLKTALNGSEQMATSDHDGYFQFHVRLKKPLKTNPNLLWQPVPIHVVDGGSRPTTVQGEVLIPPAHARNLVISDIDDTVIHTGVANKLKMVFRLFVQGVRSRVAFPGTAALYNALHHGPSGAELNPMLYVSRGPWGIYEILEEFFNLHQIPVGPVLFLREWGVSLRRPFPRRSRGHKAGLIRKMLALYQHLPCVLIGDSGQHDPEIYARIVHDHPGRVKAVYIRNVSRSEQRIGAINHLAEEITSQGSALFLASDTFAMARHMADAGLISDAALADVLNERRLQEGRVRVQPTHHVSRPSPEQTRSAISGGELKRVLNREDATGPPNVAVGSDSNPDTKASGSA